jgi:hypothetical protein
MPQPARAFRHPIKNRTPKLFSVAELLFLRRRLWGSTELHHPDLSEREIDLLNFREPILQLQ